MGSFQDRLPSNQVWIHEIARAEMNPEAERILQLGKSFDPQQLVEESAINFLTELRESFEECARILNSYSENGTRFQEVKIYSLAQTPSDFMLFRNRVKLIFANVAQGIIQISFSQHQKGALAIDGQSSKESSSQPSNELLAQLGPFRDVYWTYQAERVSPPQIAKFYFGEFSRVSRDLRRSKAGNQILIDQIKALLQEKGLEL